MSEQVPSKKRLTWRCFHCGDVFATRAAAAEHFGPTLTSDAACQIDVAEYRRMEENHRRHCEEDTELHRGLSSEQARRALAVREAEELGYARGLKDGRGLADEKSVARCTSCGATDDGAGRIYHTADCKYLEQRFAVETSALRGGRWHLCQFVVCHQVQKCTAPSQCISPPAI